MKKLICLLLALVLVMAMTACGGNDAVAEKNISDGATDIKTPKGKIHCMSIIGQIEGHMILSSECKATKYEHIIPQLVAIEQDADGVLFNFPAVQKDECSWANDDSGATSLTVIVEKNRHGATGDVEMNWYKKPGRIVEV